MEAQILDLLEGLRRSRGLSMLLVSHNLGIVDRLCDDHRALCRPCRRAGAARPAFSCALAPPTPAD
ncbi:MAG: hypothetical protein M5U08_13945 [Burkholderiales bacterium]|nr:hypothetical protein [Burkholderiales bacterium]